MAGRGPITHEKMPGSSWAEVRCQFWALLAGGTSKEGPQQGTGLGAPKGRTHHGESLSEKKRRLLAQGGGGGGGPNNLVPGAVVATHVLYVKRKNLHTNKKKTPKQPVHNERGGLPRSAATR